VPADRSASLVRLRRGTVVAVSGERAGALELRVAVDGREGDAVAYPGVVGPVGVGDAVVLNTTARHLGLGTGGFDLVVAVEAGRDVELGHGGRVMKARYTPTQVAVPSVEETHRDALEGSRRLDGTPVVAAPLHSMIAPIAAGAKAAGDARVVYVMTDGAALPGSFSRLVPALRAAALVDGFVTAGQAFGGEVEAVSLWTGLLAAVAVLHAEVVVVADGPGNLGTDTTWGVSALSNGFALDAAETLGGRPVAALRVSFADPRARHRGISHHSLTILADVCHVAANVAVPALPDDQRGAVWDALRARTLEETHQLVEVDGRPALDELDRRGVNLTSMGRSPADDPAFFLAAGAAGVLAGRMAAAARAYRHA
jgi:ribosomal protein S28E/S33